MVFNTINTLHNNSTELTNPIDKIQKLKMTANSQNSTITTTDTTASNSKFNKMNGDLCNMLNVTNRNNSSNSSNNNNKNNNNNTNDINGKVCHSLSIGSLSTNKSSSSSTSSSSSSSSSGSNVSKKQLSTEDKKINLNALKNQDPFATNIIDTAFRVAVYKFVSKKNEWKKLDVEGSLFLFERMVEPLHSFVVMNTLALHLFLQPITADLEFQDRNPFLLYKSNNDIFGIWFIDKEDCDRVKTTIMDLTESARDRKIKREKSKLLDNMQQTAASASIPRLVTPTALVEAAACYPQGTDNTNINAYDKLFPSNKPTTEDGSVSKQTNNEKSSCDIMQMLTKAQLEFNQLKGTSSVAQAPASPKPILDQLSGGLLLSQMNKPEAIRASNNLETLPISLNTSSCLSSSPSTSSTSTGYSTSSSAGNLPNNNQKEINPMIQKLLSNPQPNGMSSQVNISSTKTLDEIESEFMGVPASNPSHDLLSEELKKKLNIKSSKVPLASSSMITTPSNPLILSGCGGLNLTDNAAIKRPITLKDFEENLLNESSASTTSTPANINISTDQQAKYPVILNQQEQKSSSPAVFYLGGNSETASVASNSNYIRPNQLSFINKKSNKKSSDVKSKKSYSSKYSSASSAASTLSSRSSRSSTSDSSTDTSSSASSSTSSSPRTLPLLLTPAAFETSSISSSTGSTSSSSKANIFNDYLNSQLLSSIDHQQKMAQKLMKKTGLPKTSTQASSIATSSFNNLLLANVDSVEMAVSQQNSTDLPKISKHMQQATVLNKPQLQQCLIHLLTSDDKFLSSLHQTYLEANLAQANKSKNSS